MFLSHASKGAVCLCSAVCLPTYINKARNSSAWSMLIVSVIAELSFWSQSSKQLGTGWSELGGQTLKLPLFHLTLLIVMAF